MNKRPQKGRAALRLFFMERTRHQCSERPTQHTRLLSWMQSQALVPTLKAKEEENPQGTGTLLSQILSKLMVTLVPFACELHQYGASHHGQESLGDHVGLSGVLGQLEDCSF